MIKEVSIAGLIIGAVAAAAFGFNKWYNSHVENRLEPYAINCGYKNNLIGFPDWKVNLPKMKNADIDEDGKLESIILYVNNGKKIYQEIRKTENGDLVLSESKQLK